MGTTNEFERDLQNQAALKRPGRIDLRIFQNISNAGDGYPGLQRCFRNYLHEGGMEKDIDLIGFSIIGTSVDINNAELQQLSNIGSSVITASIWSQIDNIEATTVSPTQWGYVGGADQALKQADSPTFNGLSLTGNISLAANSIIGTGVDLSNAKLQEFSNIGSVTITATQWGYLGELDQALKQAESPTFVGLTLSADVITTSTFDSVNVSDLKDSFDTHTASTGASHTYIDQSVVIASSPTFVGLTLSADLVTTSTIDGIDVSAIKLNSMPTAADGDISANTQKIINVVDPTDNQDASTKIYVDSIILEGIASDDLVFSNDTERVQSSQTYVKIKELRVYRNVKIKVYWEAHATADSDVSATRVYINGVAVGSEHSNPTDSYVAFTENITVNIGDYVQIYGYAATELPATRACTVRYQRVKFIEYVITAGY